MKAKGAIVGKTVNGLGILLIRNEPQLIFAKVEKAFRFLPRTDGRGLIDQERIGGYRALEDAHLGAVRRRL